MVKLCSAAALSLGLFLSSPVIITPKASFTSYVEEGSRYSYKEHGWYYTRKEVKEIYEKEYEEGLRLKNYVRKENGKHIAPHKGKIAIIPEKFIKQTLRQLEEVLEKGYAEYIFRLDAFHSHLFIPEEAFPDYKDLYGVERIEAYTKDGMLGALYHNTEHLALRDEKGEVDPVAQDLLSKRSVLGWYDGRPLELTHPKDDAPQKIKEANNASIPDGHCSIGNLTFMATKNGEFSIKHNGKEIRVDISFDDFNYY